MIEDGRSIEAAAVVEPASESRPDPHGADRSQDPSDPGRTEATRMGRNYSALAIAGVITQGLTLLVSITLARYLQPSNWGLFLFGFNFPQWFTILVDLGLDSVVTIDVAANRKRASDYMTAVAVIRSIPLVAGLASLAIAVHFVLADPSAQLVTFVLGAAILLGTFTQLFSGVFRAFERMEYLAFLSVLAQVLTTAGVLVLILLGFGLLPIAFVYLGVIVVYAAAALVIVRRRFPWFSRHVDREVIGHILRTTGPFAVDDVVSAFMVSGAPVLLTLMAGDTQTALFGAAFAIMTALRYPLTLYYTTALPTMSRFHEESREKLGIALRKSQKLFYILGAPLAFGGWYYRESLLQLVYGSGYAGSGAVFGILVWAVAVSTATLGVGMTLAATGRQKLNVLIGGIGVVMNMVLCLVLIPFWGPTGAAVAFLAATIYTAAASTFAVHRLVVRVDLAGTLLRPTLSGGVLLSLLIVFNPPLWIGVGAGSLAYFALLLALRGIDREDLDLLRQVTRGALLVRQ